MSVEDGLGASPLLETSAGAGLSLLPDDVLVGREKETT